MLNLSLVSGAHSETAADLAVPFFFLFSFFFSHLGSLVCAAVSFFCLFLSAIVFGAYWHLI
jgi:hypothetical protein